MDDANQLSGSGNLVKTGGGSLFLGGAGPANFTGQLTVNEGSLTVSAAGTALGSNAFGQGVIINSGATMTLAGTGFTLVGEPITVGGTGILQGGVLTNTGANSYIINPGTGSGTFTLSADSNIAITAAGGITINSAIGDGGAGYSLTKIVPGAGALVLQGANTYSGATIVNGGTLTLSGLGTILNSSGVSVANGGTLRVTTLRPRMSVIASPRRSS